MKKSYKKPDSIDLCEQSVRFPIEDYDVINEELGRGGMGVVKKVIDRKTGDVFALKELSVFSNLNLKNVSRLRRETELMRILHHKNIVRAYKTGAAEGSLYILMELCEGGDVTRLMEAKGGILSVELATYIILQVLSALDYVHRMNVRVLINNDPDLAIDTWGIVHRDIKPQNILLSDLSDKPIAKVADFGLAKAYRTSGVSDISMDNDILGTPQYMPRQAVEAKYARPEVDVWAAAACYYRMLTGCIPRDFQDNLDNKGKIQVVMTQRAVPIRERNPDVPRGLADVIDWALHDDPDIFYPQASFFMDAIIDALPDYVKEYCHAVLP